MTKKFEGMPKKFSLDDYRSLAQLQKRLAGLEPLLENYSNKDIQALAKLFNTANFDEFSYYNGTRIIGALSPDAPPETQDYPHWIENSVHYAKIEAQLLAAGPEAVVLKLSKEEKSRDFSKTCLITRNPGLIVLDGVKLVKEEYVNGGEPKVCFESVYIPAHHTQGIYNYRGYAEGRVRYYPYIGYDNGKFCLFSRTYELPSNAKVKFEHNRINDGMFSRKELEELLRQVIIV